MSTRADRGDWDMHPSDADPEVPETVDAVTEISAWGSSDPIRVDEPACMTERRRRSLDEAEADEAGDAYEQSITKHWDP